MDNFQNLNGREAAEIHITRESAGNIPSINTGNIAVECAGNVPRGNAVNDKSNNQINNKSLFGIVGLFPLTV